VLGNINPQIQNASTFHNEGFTKGDVFRITIVEKFYMMPHESIGRWLLMGCSWPWARLRQGTLLVVPLSGQSKG
jgi:hypothetical protein